VVWASTFAPEGLREHVLVERQVGDQALQPCILVLELAHAAHLVDAEVPIALLPHVEGRLADAELAAHVADRRACLRLAERVGDLLLRKLRPLHPVPPLPWLRTAGTALTLVLGCRRFRGTRH